MQSMMSQDQIIKRYIELMDKKKDIQGELSSINVELANLESLLVSDLQARDIQSINQSGRTIYLIRNLSFRPSVVDGPHEEEGNMVSLFIRAKRASLLSVNHAKVRAWLKDILYDARTGTWEINAKRLPRTLRGAIEISEFYRVGCRKSN